MQRWARLQLGRHAIALAAMAAALALRVALTPWLDQRLPYLTLFGAVAAAAWWCGSVPALVAAALGYVGANWLLPAGSGGWAELAGYGLSSGLIVLFGHRMRVQAERLAAEVQQRAAAEREARGVAERLETTLRSIGDGVIVVDAQGRVVVMNPVAESLTAWSEADARGRPLGEVFDIIDELRRLPVPNPALRAIETGCVVGLANHTLLRARDGRDRPIDDSAAPLRARDGRIDGAVLVFRDLGPRLAEAAALRRSESVLRAMYESTTLCLGVLELDADGGLRHVQDNAGTCRLYKVAPGATAGRRPGDLGAAPAVVALWSERCRACERAAAPLAFEFEIPRGERPALWHRATIALLPAETPGLARFTYVSEDITPHKQAERQQADAERRKNEFIATLAHELRNPLAPLASGLALLQRSGDDAAVRARTLALLHRQLALMVRLIDDLLDIQRISHDRLRLHRATVDLVTALQDGLDSGEPLLAARGHHLHVELPPRPVWVDGDAARLSQVLANLLSNAARYTPPGGHVRVVLHCQGDTATLSVEDDGIGIPPDMLGRVFEMFSQVDRRAAPGQGGLGIGLAICRRLVELHGGRLQATSEGEGRGSRFVVTLPCVPAPVPPPPAPAAPPPAAAGLRVLVVDDNVDAAGSLRELLALGGHRVAVAHDGPGALAAAAELRPQLVLLDLGLPGMDGLEVADRLRGLPGLGPFRLVALTGWGHADDRARTRSHGFDEHLVKPVDPQALERLLAEAPA